MAVGIAGSLIAGGLGLASGLITNIFNKKMQDDANEITKQNNQFQQEQYLDEKAYNRELQERLFNREDNAYQRTVDDIQKSGLSALAMNGTNNAGSVVSQAQMPELNSITPFQAQNLDFGQLADIIGQADQRQLERDKFEYQKKKDMSDKEFAEAQAQEQTRQFNESLQVEVNKMKQQGSQFIIQHGLEATKQAKQAKLIDKQIDQIAQMSKLEDNKAKNEELVKAYQRLGGECEFFSDKEKFDVADAQYKIQEQAMLAECEEILKGNTSESKSKSESKNYSGGVGVKGIASADGSYGNSSSDSESYSKDLLAQVNAKKEKFYKSVKKPIYWP